MWRILLIRRTLRYRRGGWWSSWAVILRGRSGPAATNSITQGIALWPPRFAFVGGIGSAEIVMRRIGHEASARSAVV